MASAAPSSLPTGPELLSLERRARRGGSGLVAADLVGDWWLDQVWPKGSGRPASFSAALLRGLGARLVIQPDGEGLALSNAVRLGALELCFRGPGRLVGSRPLLEFRFETLTLNLAGWTVLRRCLPEPAPRRVPFFALITRSPQGWLAARGRGGGLALWRLPSAPAASADGGAGVSPLSAP
jgi:hypothetical protein